MSQVKEMPVLATKAFGTIEVRPEQLIRFPDGLFGFKTDTEYALLEEAPNAHFKWLQSTANPSVAFVVIQPELFMREPYRPSVSSAELDAINVSSVAECLVFVIVTIPYNEPDKMTANLQGPILINAREAVGRQAISANDGHPVRYPILDRLED